MIFALIFENKILFQFFYYHYVHVLVNYSICKYLTIIKQESPQNENKIVSKLKKTLFLLIN